MFLLERRAFQFVFLAIGTCFGLTVRAQEVPRDEASFTEFVAMRVRQEVGDAPVVVKSPLTLSVGPLQANLDRVFAFCRSNSSGCAPELERYAKGVAQVLKQQSAPIDRAAVRLVVRTSQYIKPAQDSLGPNGPTLQARPIAEGLVAVAVIDTPRAVRPLDERDLKALGVTQDGLFEIGTANLDSSLRPLSETAKPVAAKQIGTVGGSIYEVGRV